MAFETALDGYELKIELRRELKIGLKRELKRGLKRELKRKLKEGLTKDGALTRALSNSTGHSIRPTLVIPQYLSDM